MSISPQSLARTRDKRTPKFPARYDDFSDIPPEVSFRNVAEALKMKGSKNRTRPQPVPLMPYISPKPRLKKTKQASTPPASSPPASTPPASTPEMVINESPPKTDTSSSATELDLECKETAPIIDDLKPSPKGDVKEIATQGTEPPSIKISTVSPILDNEGNNDVCMASSNEASCDGSESVNIRSIDSLENENDKESKDLSESKRKNPDKAEIVLEDQRKNVFGIRKSPFHPSITIHNSGSDFDDSARLMKIHRSKPKAAPPSGSKTTIESGSISRSSKKKSKGLSLMIKPKHGPFQANNSINNRSAVNNSQLQPATYFNNAPQQMQYGTRLMINEPIYLPRSVATIAPITTTLQQIANQARRPPFLSKKAEAYLAYQEDRKLNYMASNYTALVNITKYLDVKDLNNLRLVNKSWKSIVGSEDVWKTVKIKSSVITDWSQFVSRVLCKYQTKELIFTEFQGIEQRNYRDIVRALDAHASYLALRRIWIQTVTPSQHTHALEFTHHLRDNLVLRMTMKVIWKVKVTITEEGLALVAMKLSNEEGVSSPLDKLAHIISDHDGSSKLNSDGTNTVLVEMDGIQTLLNRTSINLRINSIDDSNGIIKNSRWPMVHLKAI